jgi:phage/conjugal plasmid C-4 type zinc finger TraR family protein
MADQFDRAQVLEERERERAIAAQLARPRPAGESRSDCLECRKPIPEARRALGGMTRCVPCQALIEKGGRQ